MLFWAWIGSQSLARCNFSLAHSLTQTGWFPFMVYSTTFVGEVLKRYDISAQQSFQSSADVVGNIARVGSMALVLFSCVSLASSILLPFVVESPESNAHKKPSHGGLVARFQQMILPFKPDLATAWICGHFMYASLMLMTMFVSTVRWAMVCVALSGVAWSLMTWVGCFLPPARWGC